MLSDSSFCLFQRTTHAYQESYITSLVASLFLIQKMQQFTPKKQKEPYQRITKEILGLTKKHKWTQQRKI